MALKYKEDPDFSAHNQRANDTAARELKDMLDMIQSAQLAKADASKEETDVYVIAKSKGYDVKALKRLVRELKRDADELRAETDALELYKQLIGMV
jgi:uncharacterized protein (UPF0335 family)